VVDWEETITGDRVIVSPHLDLPIGTILPWNGSVAQSPVRPGWYLCDGQNGTIDLRARFIVGYYSGGLPEKGGLGAAGDYSALGQTGGHAWHGIGAGAGNNHPDHPEHRHQLDSSTYTKVAVAAGGIADVIQEKDQVAPYTSGSAALPGGDPPDWGHGCDDPQETQDTDNRPPYYVLAFIERRS